MNKRYTFRAGLVFLFFCFLYLAIACNLYLIQIKQRDFFNNLAQQQYTLSITTHPPRALILDRVGVPLTINKESISAFIEPSKITNIAPLERFLKKEFPQSLERLKAHRDAQFLFIKRKLSPEQRTAIEQNEQADIQFMKEPHRWYPMESMGHIIGITDIDNHGLFGIESMFNNRLAGLPSTFALQKDARSGTYYFAKKTTKEGHEGEPVKLTIDSTLQFLAYEDLKDTVNAYNAREGAVLVLNPKTGEIIVMAQYPNFDPNNTQEVAMELTKNRAVTESYELGSVMKAFTALAALEEQVVTADEMIDCRNMKVGYFDGFKISTWKAHDMLSFSEVIELSNNFGVADIGKRLGPKLYEHYKRLGFGQKTALNWPGEQAGFVNPPSSWSRQSIISLSFGYELSATLLQLALSFCMIANNGIPVIPSIIAYPQQHIAQPTDPIYRPDTIATIRGILERTVSQGTAHRGKIKGYKVMGKTGTANMVVDGKYDTKRNTYTFAGILEKGDYQRVIVTFIREVPNPHSMLYASSVAVPLFEKVAEHVILHDRVL
ncbi:MAG TPA: penicillin-binding protein 2 [Candidatus Babeliales bacterium]|nr:penicillin-binding protein 2 [Candidatus Babeliales bacterium]